ncbi:MAG: hypothetical protein JW846_01690 [Dehalococcoidia bacterium]|nr:hypothetical protein [Dehalococcoidia bacterium]
MRLRVLGAHNLSSSETKCVSLIIDDVLALDAGSLTEGLSFAEQSRLEAVFLSHRHYDHIRDIPALGLNLWRMATSADVFCSEEVRHTLITCLLNGEVYPRLHMIPDEKSTLRFTLIEPNASVTAGSHTITPILVSHVNHTMGFQVKDNNGRVLFYTSDTGPLPDDFWKNISPSLLVVEVTAPNHQTKFVRAAGHMTPLLLEKELVNFRSFHGDLPKILTVHMDPLLGSSSELEEELTGVAERQDASITMAREGMEVEV